MSKGIHTLRKRMWYVKPHWWQFRKKRYYRNILETSND